MGKMGPSDSFAELSLLLDEPITCSVITATDIEMGIVRPECLTSKLTLLESFLIKICYCFSNISSIIPLKSVEKYKQADSSKSKGLNHCTMGKPITHW